MSTFYVVIAASVVACIGLPVLRGGPTVERSISMVLNLVVLGLCVAGYVGGVGSALSADVARAGELIAVHGREDKDLAQRLITLAKRDTTREAALEDKVLDLIMSEPSETVGSAIRAEVLSAPESDKARQDKAIADAVKRTREAQAGMRAEYAKLQQDYAQRTTPQSAGYWAMKMNWGLMVDLPRKIPDWTAHSSEPAAGAQQPSTAR